MKNIDWTLKITEYGIPMKHPKYNDDETYIMDALGARGLRFSEGDKGGKAPHYLVMREAMRRLLRGKGSQKNNYSKLVVRAFERMKDELLDENSKELGGTYRARPEWVYPTSLGKKKFGTENAIGEFWSPCFRKWYPHEEFIVIGRIDRLLSEWYNTTYRDGKNLNLDIGELRRERKANGTAEAMILSYQLPVEQFMSKLVGVYNART